MKKRLTILLNKLLKDKTDDTLIQFFRYLFVGGIATVVDWGISGLSYSVLFPVFRSLPTEVKTADVIAALLANTIGFLFGLTVNYLISTKWVFTENTGTSAKKVFWQFAAIGVAGLVITWAITLFMTSVLNGIPYTQMIAKVISTAAAFLWNFFARKYMIFGKK